MRGRTVRGAPVSDSSGRVFHHFGLKNPPGLKTSLLKSQTIPRILEDSCRARESSRIAGRRG